MLKVIKSTISCEAKYLDKKDVNIFKGHSASTDYLLKFDWISSAKLLETRAPYFYYIPSSVCFPGKNLSGLMTAAAVLLYSRSQRLSQIQYILGLTLNKCGLTKEGIKLMHDIGISVSAASIHRKKKQLIKQQETWIADTVSHYVKNKESEATNADNPVTPIEILGDNIDVTITPAKMTAEKQRKSLHWFLIMAKQKRITIDDYHVPNHDVQSEPILQLPSQTWIPSLDDVASLFENIAFHISHILLNQVPFLKPVNCFPKYITHQFMEKTKSKSIFLNCDLIEASENCSQGMISILQRIHQLSVPHARPEKKVIEKIVFGGDVLTNERAFSAQEAMQNNLSDFQKLQGVIHRPEGLHRQMNFLLAIYQQFYKERSSVDKGSLYQLRNLINRRNVSGPEGVISSYRPHQQFVEDVTDAYVVAAFLDNNGMDEVTSVPLHPPVFSLMDDSAKIDWVMSASKQVIQTLQLSDLGGLNTLRQNITALDFDTTTIETMKVGDTYSCPMCDKSFRKVGWFRKHLFKKHPASENSNPVQCFLLMSLLYRDTGDSYKMGDGDRIIRNAYMEWLFASALNHYKYKIWLWRMISYVVAILTPEQSFEYKWNMTVNLKGGLHNDIPNDNCVEIQVHNIKSQLNTQGSNKSFASARSICMTTQVKLLTAL